VISNRSKSGLCKKHYCYQWKSLNPEKAAAASKRTYEKNREFYIKNTAQRRSIARKNNPVVKIRDSLRRRLNNAIKRNIKTGSAVNDLGCSLDNFRLHLESKFQSGMTWDNYGRKPNVKCWEIDHIIPLSSFDLQDSEQLKKACHYTNLQPLWAEDNARKNNKRPC
jgi:hypothetical protein